VYESPHVVEIAFVHDDPTATRPVRLGRRHLDRDAGGHRDDVAARRHRIGSGQAGQLQRTSQQGMLLRGECAVASRLVEQQLEFGRASAIGIVLTLIIMGVTALQFRLSRRFVFYQ